MYKHISNDYRNFKILICNILSCYCRKAYARFRCDGLTSDNSPHIKNAIQTYDVRLLYGNRKMAVRFLRVSHVARAASSPKTLHVVHTFRSYLYLEMHLQSPQSYFLTLRLTTAAKRGKTRSTHTITKHARSIVNGA